MAADNFVDNKLLCGVTNDLDEELFHFSNHKPWQSGLFSKILVKADDLRIVLIAMDVGATMKEHHTDGTTSIQVLQGRLCIHIEDKTQHLQTRQMLTLAAGIKHDLEALDDSAFLLTISWPASAELQSLPHRGYGS